MGTNIFQLHVVDSLGSNIGERAVYEFVPEFSSILIKLCTNHTCSLIGGQNWLVCHPTKSNSYMYVIIVYTA